MRRSVVDEVTEMRSTYLHYVRGPVARDTWYSNVNLADTLVKPQSGLLLVLVVHSWIAGSCWDCVLLFANGMRCRGCFISRSLKKARVKVGPSCLEVTCYIPRTAVCFFRRWFVSLCWHFAAFKVQKQDLSRIIVPLQFHISKLRHCNATRRTFCRAFRRQTAGRGKCHRASVPCSRVFGVCC